MCKNDCFVVQILELECAQFLKNAVYNMLKFFPR